MGDLLGINKAAKTQANATKAAATQQATSDNYQAQAAAQSLATSIAQTKATQTAAELVSAPPEQVDVNLASRADGTSLDATGKRRSTRAKFTLPDAAAGLNIN